uniref:Uncharacterized protein n=1 Tax=Trypanosoma congolense (strain IL3000) TaxID=1068625 RepID=G0UNQ8_TRYCI|nr:hypothetical protein, unlikely [Trypanosoma congolense IL3000]
MFLYSVRCFLSDYSYYCCFSPLEKENYSPLQSLPSYFTVASMPRTLAPASTFHKKCPPFPSARLEVWRFFHSALRQPCQRHTPVTKTTAATVPPPCRTPLYPFTQNRGMRVCKKKKTN